MSQIRVTDVGGTMTLPRINIRIAEGAQSSDAAIFDVFTDDVGATGWPIPYFPNGNYTLYVNDRNVNEGYEATSLPVTMPSGDIAIELRAKPVTLSRLVRIDSQAHRMVNEKGQGIYGRGASAFLLYKKYLDGKDIVPVLDQLQQLGCNLIRIMGSFESLGGFNPKAYGQTYYDAIPHFMNIVERKAIYGLWTACAATGAWFTEDEAIDHIRHSVERLLVVNNPVFSPVNEQGQHNNNIDRVRCFNDVLKPMIGDPSGPVKMLYDTGSFGVDSPTAPPFGTHTVLHTTRSYPGLAKDGNIIDHPNHVAQGLDVGIDEPYRAGDEGSGDYHDDPRVAREAAGSAYTALFWVFHSMQGERGDVLTGNTLDCAVAAANAMRGH